MLHGTELTENSNALTVLNGTRITRKKWWHTRKDHRDQNCIYQAKYYKDHEEEMRVSHAAYARAHLPEFAARCAARYAKIRGAAVGNLKEIKELYRIAKKSPRVRCYLCKNLIPIGHRHVDHIFPVSKGGPHRSSNLAVTCDECNWKKKDKLPEEVGVLI